MSAKKLDVWCTTLRVRPGRWLTALAGIAALLSMIFLPTAVFGAPNIATMMVAGMSATVFGAVVASRRLRRDTNLSIDPPRIEDAFSAGSKLVLHLTSGAVVEAEPRDRTPDDILAELGLTLDQRALSAPLRGILGSFTRGLLAFMTTWMAAIIVTIPIGSPLLTSLAPLVVAIAMTVLVVRTLRPRVTVGLDGLRVSGVLRPKFVPFARIRGVRVADYQQAMAEQPIVGQVIVVETADKPLVLPLIGQSAEQTAALVRRIEQGRARWAAEEARALDVLDRAGRSMADWVAYVRKLPAGGSFRTAALDRTDLARVVADPKVSLERRLGAALALQDDPEARKQVRVAAEQSAEPRVRIALEAASSEEIDEDAIERALKD